MIPACEVFYKMSEPKLEEELETDWRDKPDSGNKKHTLDSDEEDDDIEESTYDVMAEDDIEGQEEGTATLDGDVRITPFNMKEELEEGHFDTQGNYHWKKEGKVIRDSWLDNIDWVKIKEATKPTEAEPESDSDVSSVAFDQIPVYRKMLEYMKPGETVAKSLRRLGGNKTMSASERWRRKKAGLQDDPGNSQHVTDLTAMANQLLSETGNMDIYQESYEHITSIVEAADMKAKAEESAKKTVARSYDDALDMYADDFDEKEKARLDEKKQKHDDGSENEEPAAKRQKTQDFQGESNANNSSASGAMSDGELMWEYKLEENATEISGPHTTSQMLQWIKSGHFKSDVWVRKCGQDGQFYTSRRVDFELYL